MTQVNPAAIYSQETSCSVHLNTSSVLQKQQEHLTNEMLTLNKSRKQHANCGLRQERASLFSCS